MESQVYVPRWTPGRSPSRSPPNEAMKSERSVDDVETGSNIASEEDRPSSMGRLFPFIVADTKQPQLHSDIREVPSLRIESNNLDMNDFGPNGLFLTWKDLWVTVPDSKNGRRAILQGLTGYAQPSEVLAIMGPSGCGKSTLLDSLAGKEETKFDSCF